MRSLKELYNININLRGLAIQGYSRPTLSEMWDVEGNYLYTWSTADPVLDSDDVLVLSSNNKAVTVPR
jgi:hypothetical protein